ncbi:MAG: hypothetical protein AB7V46_16920 [Thermomicrobiales bacterium]
MKKLLVAMALFMGAFGGTALAKDHMYCNENIHPSVGECHANHGHPKGH